ncbi:acyl-CoA dehydrogenase family protein [Erysipelothrix urinaevulpis]|uniref:acyl-CoA dehydrogenase family protein n=1 Tax=Erysipelothrix urinaevulpis TaxID=2683717 RepID=UPI00135A95DB|nr:acyl-CoA dehydrogenase family protein [Erysipelothrix urinaevulpis]
MLDLDFGPDLLAYSNDLTDGEKEVLAKVRTVLNEKVKPVINQHWENATFPYEEFAEVVNTGIMSDSKLYEGRDGTYSQLYNVFLYYELARVDASIATYYTVHVGLYRTALKIGGSQEQIERFEVPARTLGLQGCFGLTEPDSGSDIAGGMSTTAEKVGDQWVINGEKRWIGGADTADEMIIFARDKADQQVKCFVVPGKAKGVSVENIWGKVSLRPVQNGHITLKDVHIDDDRRLVNINSFKDVNKILQRTRADVAHIATGIQAGALEAALNYVKERKQFGRPVASFQIIQDKISKMAANLTSSLALSVQLAKQQDEHGIYSNEESSLVKMNNALRMRETVALAREIVGGNGITLDTDVARFFADAEAIYTYEGSHEINSLIVGRGLTDISAFV